MAVKTEEIKVRTEPLIKLSLEQIAQEEHLDLSEIARRAYREFIHNYNARKQQQHYAKAA